jgi:hypothetical protein
MSFSNDSIYDEVFDVRSMSSASINTTLGNTNYKILYLDRFLCMGCCNNNCNAIQADV